MARRPFEDPEFLEEIHGIISTLLERDIERRRAIEMRYPNDEAMMSLFAKPDARRGLHSHFGLLTRTFFAEPSSWAFRDRHSAPHKLLSSCP